MPRILPLLLPKSSVQWRAPKREAMDTEWGGVWGGVSLPSRLWGLGEQLRN